MTEAEWLNTATPFPLLRQIFDESSCRKLSLFYSACLDRIAPFFQQAERMITKIDRAVEIECEVWEQLDESEVELAEQVYSRNTCDFLRPWTARQAVLAAVLYGTSLSGWDEFHRAEVESFRAEGDIISANNSDAHARFFEEFRVQANAVREIFGNPFRPVTLEPAWQTSNVVSLAQAIYDERVFDRMPILADALEDAGCTNPDVLNHCRHPGEHVRGCWVVDLLLGKQ